jgi:hypothetical protein
MTLWKKGLPLNEVHLLVIFHLVNLEFKSPLFCADANVDIL